MSHSLEDLRDSYKNSRQSKNAMHGLNGASFKKIRELNSKNRGDVISWTNKANTIDEDLIRINKIYDLVDSQTEYSLNKKKRWEVNNQLKSKMEEFNSNDVDLRLYETIDVKNRNLISHHKSKDEPKNDQQQKKNKKTYGNYEAILKQDLNTSKKEEEMNRSINQLPKSTVIYSDHDLTDMNAKEYVEYLIVNKPRKNFLKHEKHIPTKEKTKLSNQRQSLKYSDYEFSSSESEQSDTESCEYRNRNTSNNINFDDLVGKYAIYLVEKHKKTESKNQKIFKNNYEILPKNEMVNITLKDFKEDTKAKMIPLTKKIEYFNLKMSKNELTTEHLKETYGNKYNEAKNCYPRQFNINISELVKSQLSTMKQNEQILKGKSMNVSIFLRFSEVATSSDCEYSFSIFHDLVKEIDFSNEFNELKIWSIEDVLKKAIDFLTALPIDSFKTEQKNNPMNKESKLISDLETIAIKQSKNIEIENLKDEILKRWPLVSSQTTITSIDVPNFLDRESFSCGLCYDEKTDFNDFLLIKTCGHYVCYECMNYYINSKLKNFYKTAGSFPCPSCDNQLDISLLINFCNYASLFNSYLQVSAEKKIFTIDNLRYCQSKDCSKILKVDLDSNPFGILSCLCGFKACLTCNQEPHFPAKCSQVKSYRKQIQDKEHFEIEENDYISLGKQCPSCKIYMEKNDGCNQMVCSSCNEKFCWDCENLWDKHLELNKGNYNCSNKGILTTEIEFEFRAKKKSKKKNLLENSLNHRSMQSLRVKSEKSKLAKRLIKTINFCKLFPSNMTINNQNEYVIPSLAKQREIESFLKDLINILIEIHFICEYSYVALRDKTNSADEKNSIAHAIKELELLIFQINNQLEYGKGLVSVDKLRISYTRSLNLIKLLNNFNDKE